MIDLLLQYLVSAEMANNQGLVLQLTIYFLDIFKIITSAFLNSISLHYKNQRILCLKIFEKCLFCQYCFTFKHIHEQSIENLVKEQTDGRNPSFKKTIWEVDKFV